MGESLLSWICNLPYIITGAKVSTEILQIPNRRGLNWGVSIFMILIHIIFRVVKFTIVVFLMGVALIGVLYVFQHYLGIDLIGEISRHV